MGEKTDMVGAKTKELYREKTKEVYKDLQKYIGEDVDASLGVLFCITVVRDILGVKSEMAEDVRNNLLGLLGDISFKTQMEAIREVDPAQFIKNCAVIGMGMRSAMDEGEK